MFYAQGRTAALEKLGFTAALRPILSLGAKNFFKANKSSLGVIGKQVGTGAAIGGGAGAVGGYMAAPEGQGFSGALKGGLGGAILGGIGGRMFGAGSQAMQRQLISRTARQHGRTMLGMGVSRGALNQSMIPQVMNARGAVAQSAWGIPSRGQMAQAAANPVRQIAGQAPRGLLGA